MTTRRETRPQTAGASQVRSDFSTGQFERGASPFVTLWAAGPIYILGSHFGMANIGGRPLVILCLPRMPSCHHSRWMERSQFGQFCDLQCLCLLNKIQLTMYAFDRYVKSDNTPPHTYTPTKVKVFVSGEMMSVSTPIYIPSPPSRT